MSKFSLKEIFLRFKSKILFTWALVVFEGVMVLLYPYFIGMAIDDLINKEQTGLILFGALGIAHLLFASGRRFYDTRIYSGIYLKIAPELVEKEFENDSDPSKVSARTKMLTELVEFLENLFPNIVNLVISLAGTLILLFFMDVSIFVASLAAAGLTILIYILSSKRTFRLNSAYNSEFERHFDIIKKRNEAGIFNHFKKMMFFNIKLSDLETVNFSINWAGFIGLLIFSLITVTSSEEMSYGKMLSVVMYVFQYIESMIILPLYYQHYIRLHEITERLSD